MTMKMYPSTTKYDWSKLSVITDQLSYRSEEFLDHLGVDYYSCRKYLAGPCPVHGGDNRTAFNFFTDGEIKCNWICYTHHCEKKNNSVFGLVQGIRKCTYKESVDFVCRFLGIDYENISVDNESYQLSQRIHQQKVLSSKRKETTGKITVETLRANLQFPCQYYLDRKYTREILTKYNVGLCTNPDKPMYNRCVVPIFNDNNEYIVGVAGRSIFDKHKCGLFHNPFESCPSNAIEIGNSSKWRNNPGFNRESYLYNYWFSRYYISKSRVVIIVEGPGDCWRLEEAGIHNSVAVFGSDITEEQMIILEGSGAMMIVPLTDNDEAGQLFKKRIKERCKNLFRIIDIQYEGKDVGELEVDYIKNNIKPQVDKLGSY